MAQATTLFVPKQRATPRTANGVHKPLQFKDKAIKTVTRPFHGLTKVEETNISDRSTDPCDQFNLPERLEAVVTLCQEVQSLDWNSDERIWSVVEINANMNSTAAEISADQPLDLVIVLDCSVYASPYCLLNTTQLVLHIARLLFSDKDRLALVASSQQLSTGEYAASFVVRNLQKIDIASIEADLNSALENRILTSTQDLDLSLNLLLAFHLLGHSINTSCGTDLNCFWKHSISPQRTVNAARAVILLSPNSSEFCDKLEVVPPIPIHIVNPGIATWADTIKQYEGWRLSSSTLETNSGPSGADMERLVDFIRQRSECDYIKSLTINVEATKGCSIEKLLGNQQRDILRPGEPVSLGVLVSTGKCNKPSYSETWRPSRTDRNDTLINELEAMLGIATQDLFIVRVSYSSSSSYPQAVSIQHYPVSLTRHDSQSNWLGYSLHELTKSQDASKLLTYKKLLHIASQSCPTQLAIKAISDIQMSGRLSPEAEAASMLLTNEIQYLLNVASKQTGATTGKHVQMGTARTLKEKKPKYEDFKVTGEARISAALTNDELYPLEETKSNESLGSRFDLDGRNCSRAIESSSGGSTSSTATVVRHDVVENRSETQDKARNIWKLIRRDSKSKKQLIREQSQSETNAMWSGSSADRMQRLDSLRQQALLSKRSIGSDTLRSLSLGSDPKLLSQPAPWL